MAFKVEYTLSAEADIDELLAWLISQYAGEAGWRWLNGLFAAIERLQLTPQRCSRYRKDPRFSYPVFQLFYGRRSRIFRILLRIDDETSGSSAFADAV